MPSKKKPKNKGVPKQAPDPRTNRFSDNNFDLVTIRDENGKPIRTK